MQQTHGCGIMSAIRLRSWNMLSRRDAIFFCALSAYLSLETSCSTRKTRPYAPLPTCAIVDNCDASRVSSDERRLRMSCCGSLSGLIVVTKKDFESE